MILNAKVSFFFNPYRMNILGFVKAKSLMRELTGVNTSP